MPGAVADPGYLLVVVAHPDDETFGCGSVIAHAAERGHRVGVCTATLGEAGEPAPGYDLAGRSLGARRQEEMHAAARILGAECLPPLGLLDSGWDGPPPAGSLCAQSEAQLAAMVEVVIARERPDIVLTISGDDGHRDHRQLAGAVARAFAATARPGASLYTWCLPNRLMRRWAEEISQLRPDTAHLALADLGTADERFTTVIDTSAQLVSRRAAIAAHASQVSPYDGLSAALAEAFLTRDHLIRVLPEPAAGQVEHELTYQAGRHATPRH